jgi:hypothetical protein
LLLLLVLPLCCSSSYKTNTTERIRRSRNPQKNLNSPPPPFESASKKQPTRGTDEFATENFPRKQTISDSQIVPLCLRGFGWRPFPGRWREAHKGSFELQVLKNEGVRCQPLEIDVLNQVPITPVPCPSSTLNYIILFSEMLKFSGRKKKKKKLNHNFFFCRKN